MNNKVLIGMSGGVDSSVAALILKQQGYDVAGATFKLWKNPIYKDNDYISQDIIDARAVCDTLGITHYVIDYMDLFQHEVIDYFVSEYNRGHTPNPCVICNKKIKFAAFLEKANELGYDYIATGHYAKVFHSDITNRYNLVQGDNDKKDQSYVLYSLSQNQLEHLLLPIGDLSKDEVRHLAEINNLVVAHKSDSQDICFIPSGNYTGFLENYTGRTSPKGNFLDINGNVLGTHLGLWHYTIGQRKGLGMTFGKPMFVYDINTDTNSVVLAENDQVFGTTLWIDNVNFIEIDDIKVPTKALTKIRYAHKKASSTIYPVIDGKMKVIFDDPQRAITKGQAVVFYLDNHVLGGGQCIEIER